MPQLQTQSTVIVVDLEATCSEDQAFRPLMETIEIGAVALRVSDLEIVGEYDSFVRPVRTQTLTPFCIGLTSITQQQVDAAPTFAEVFPQFCAWVASWERPSVWVSFGNYDLNQLKKDCLHHGLELDLPPHVNAKEVVQEFLGGKRLGLKESVEKLGLTFTGTYHRGIDDARNAAKVVAAFISHSRL